MEWIDDLIRHGGFFQKNRTMNQITYILVERLEKMGMGKTVIPGFIRILSNAVLPDPLSTLAQVNERLRFLGWDDFELDYHTLQLAVACFEAEGMKRLGNRPGQWFESTFSSLNEYTVEYQEPGARIRGNGT